jgi:hypothetical protein
MTVRDWGRDALVAVGRVEPLIFDAENAEDTKDQVLIFTSR